MGARVLNERRTWVTKLSFESVGECKGSDST
jgi:hypothetical protein